MERRRLLSNRRNGRPFEGCARGRACDHDGWRHGAPALRRSRRRAPCRPGERRSDRNWAQSGRRRWSWQEGPGPLRSATSSAFASRRLPCANPFSPWLLAQRVCPMPCTLQRVSLTRRSSGGYTLAISGRARVDPTPQQFRFAREFVPMFARRWRSLAPGAFEGMRQGHESLAKWALDETTPMELNRTLNPRPDMRQIRRHINELANCCLNSVASQSPMSGPAILTAHRMAFPQSVKWGRFQALSLRPDLAAMVSGLAPARGI